MFDTRFQFQHLPSINRNAFYFNQNTKAIFVSDCQSADFVCINTFKHPAEFLNGLWHFGFHPVHFLGGIYKQFVCLLCSVCEWIDGVIYLIQITYIIQ